MQFVELSEFQALRALSVDGRLLFVTRAVRLFAYGFLSVVLALYLAAVGLNDAQIGGLLTAALVGDVVISLLIALIADRSGRRRMLLIGAGLMILAGAVFVLTGDLLLLAVAAIVGTISPSGNEVGAFLSIEQAILPQTAPDRHRTRVFAWYNLVGSFAAASGALCGGALAQALQTAGSTPLDSYRMVVLGYALLGVFLGLLFLRLSPAVEIPAGAHREGIREALRGRFGLNRSRRVVLRLSGLFMLDAFAGGLVLQSLMAYWFRLRFGVDEAALGVIFFAGNIFAGLSSLAAARLAARIGLVNTMVWTHIPSNILLMLVPLMPSLPLAAALLLARYSISQMDVPTRQSYIMAVVDPDERSAAAGVTSIARTAGSSAAPSLTGALLEASLLSLPFVLAGALKIIYDLALYSGFLALKPPEERSA